MIRLLFAALIALAPSIAYAADVAQTYGIPGSPVGARIPAAVGGLCASADGSTTAVACPASSSGPATATSTTVAGTITTASASSFQSVLSASATRQGCMIVNKSTAPENVFLGAPGSGTPATSILLAAGTATSDGGMFNCASPGVIVGDQISMSSAISGSAFLVISQ